MDARDYGCAQALPDRRWWLTKKASAFWKMLKRQTYLHVYCRHLYQPHMRYLHKRGRHWWTFYNIVSPEGGQPFHRCEWCGAMKHESRGRPPRQWPTERAPGGNGIKQA